MLSVPWGIDYASVVVGVLTGALFGCRRKFDVVGITALGFLTGSILLLGLILMILARGTARRTGLVGARIVVIFTLRLEFFHENLRFSSSRTDVYRSVHADISCACLRFMYFC